MNDNPAPSERDPVKRRVPLHTKILIGLLIGATLGIAANIAGAIPVSADAKHPQDADQNGVDDRVDWVASNIADPVGKIFLRLMFMVVLPLVFSALALAVVELGDVRQLGRVGLRTLGYTAVLSSTAVLLGLTLVNSIQPGKRLSEEKRAVLERQYADGAKKHQQKAKERKSTVDTIVDIVPQNPLQEMVGALDGSSPGNGMLAVMFFALVFGVAMTTEPEKCQTLVQWLQGLFAISMKVIGFAMRLAPLGAACLIFAIAARLGPEILVTMFWFVLTVMTGLALHLIVTYSAVISVAGGMSPWRFFRSISEAMMVAFGTSSSNATLPTAVKVANDNLRLPPKIANFVLTVGATGNQNGTALYEGVVVLFLAQVFGVELSFPQQVTVVLMSILAGIGTAGVPGGSLPLIVVLLETVKVPGESIGIILGIDRILDMCRTVLNVTGDLVVATCVSHAEGKSVVSE